MKLHGVMPALITPFDSDNRVSEPMLRRLVDHYAGIGMHGLYVCGGTGEGILLTVEERKRVTEIVVDEARGRLAVIVHVGAVGTTDAAELAAHAGPAGADAISSVPPFYYRVSTEAIFQHYSAIAERSSLPFLLYNMPASTGVTVTPDMMKRFLDIPTVAGMKFSSYNLFQMRQILELEPGRMTVFSGNDEVFLAALAMGAQGAIGLTLNFMPKLFLDTYSHFQAGRVEAAQQSQFLANRVIGVILQYNSLSAGKEVMRFKGYDCGFGRGPIERLTEEQKRELREQLEATGYFDSDVGL